MVWSNNFKPGDVVQLKSGGVGMTVIQVNGSNLVTCEWLDNGGAPQKFVWADVALQKADASNFDKPISYPPFLPA